MPDRIDELVAMLTARLCLSPDCSGDVSCEDCQDIAREALGELAAIAQEAEQLRKERDWLASAEQYIAAAREAVKHGLE